MVRAGARGGGSGGGGGRCQSWRAAGGVVMEGQRWLPLEANPEVTNQVSAVSVIPDPGVLSAFAASLLAAGLHLCIPEDSGISSLEPPPPRPVCGCGRLRPFQATTWLLEMPVLLCPPAGPQVTNAARDLGV
ncbi:hypothetical protein LEMLEM_LOCUS6465 [Lemmus lemmus]